MINKFIGSGIVFPLELDSSGKVVVYNDNNLIMYSIMSIINWPQTHRFFNENYGSRLNELLEEPNDNITYTLLKHFITDAITKWEKRVTTNNSNIKIVRHTTDKIDISVTYTINSTKQEETFIFPFYKEIIY